jgi:hypothetical protein
VEGKHIDINLDKNRLTARFISLTNSAGCTAKSLYQHLRIMKQHHNLKIEITERTFLIIEKQ